MSTRILRALAVAVVVLFAAVWLLNRQRSVETTTEELLFPGLKERLDDVTEVRIAAADTDVRVVREGDHWVVPAKGGYRADTAALRELLLAIAEARKIEQKTSNSELYDRLGVQDPREEGGKGVLVESEGLDDADFSLILGDAVQREYRYVRIADEATSWLVDRNPEAPDDASEWLSSDVADIASSRVRSITIAHEDGETIRIRKASEDDTNFTVENIPEGRELSYPSVANSIAAALDNLTLEDVRAATAGATGDRAAEETGAKPVTTVFTTFDGLELTVQSTSENDETWVGLRAEALPQPGTGEGDGTEGADGAADAAPEAPSDESAASSADEAAGEGEAPAETTDDGAATEAEDAETPDPAGEAAGINARVSGWEYRIPGYKASQLRRRWEDLLSDAAAGEE